MSHSLNRLFELCDQGPEDAEAWETLSKFLERRGYEGPLATFVKEQAEMLPGLLIRQERARKLSQESLEAWAPLLDQGFVLFQNETSRGWGVLHVARLRLYNGDKYTRERVTEDLEAWNEGRIYPLCDAHVGFAYPFGVWTRRRKPLRGDEGPPCQSCLRYLGGRAAWFWLPEDDDHPADQLLTQEQWDRLRKLRDNRY